MVRLLAVGALGLLLVGCNGGTVDRHALTNDAATIDSINCEAWLLSDAVARGRTTSQFTGAQAEALRVQAANLADALGSRPTAEGLQTQVRAKARDANVLAERLHRLRARPGDNALGAELAARFKRAGRCA